MIVDNIVSFITQFVIIFGMYISIFWIIVHLNSKNDKYKLKKYPEVTILVPAYNEEIGLERTIKSILNLKYPGGVRMFIINDASKDRTLQIAKAWEKKHKNVIKVIDKKKNAGKAAAINTALEYVKTDYFAVVDADSEIHSGSLKEIVPHLHRKSEVKIGAVISKMKPENESNNLLERVQLIEYMMVGLIRNLTSKLGLLDSTPGVLSLYSTKAVNEIGRFDPKNLTEDFEVAVRLRKSGYHIIYAYSSNVYTTTPSNFKAFLAQRIRWSRGFIQTHRKHKRVILNPKYGMYGLYQFPMNIFGPILYFLAAFAISYKLIKESYEFLYKFFINPDLINWFDLSDIGNFILGVDPSVDLFLLLSFIIVLLFLFLMVRLYEYNFLAKQPFKKLVAMLVYFMFYNYIYIYVWIVSLRREIRKEKYNWGR